MLTWNWVLIMIFKPSEESVHGREDLSPVAESFWRHCHILYPVRSSECRRAQEMTGCFRAIPAALTLTGHSQNRQDLETQVIAVLINGQTYLRHFHFVFKQLFQNITPFHAKIYHSLPIPMTPSAQGSTACGSQLVRNRSLPGEIYC